MKSLKPTDALEIEIPHFKHPDFRPWAAMVLSIVSIALSVFTWIRIQDDSHLKTAYEAQSKAIKELSAQNQEISQEIAVLRGYAEGQSKSLTVAVPVKPGSSATPAGAFSVQVPIHLVPFKDVKPDEWSSPVPAARPTLKPVVPPSFEELGKK